MIVSGLLRPLLSLLVLLSMLLGVGYPLAVLSFARLAFPWQAEGSLVSAERQSVGSILIGQTFTRPEFFWGRPSATAPEPNNASASAGSNLGPLNPALREAVRHRVWAVRHADPGNSLPIPIDLVTASASGLDPHISPEAALLQVSRIARVRGLPEERVRRVVADHTEGRWLGTFGEPRVNVLLLNLALKAMEKSREK